MPLLPPADPVSPPGTEPRLASVAGTWPRVSAAHLTSLPVGRAVGGVHLLVSILCGTCFWRDKPTGPYPTPSRGDVERPLAKVGFDPHLIVPLLLTERHGGLRAAENRQTIHSATFAHVCRRRRIGRAFGLARCQYRPVDDDASRLVDLWSALVASRHAIAGDDRWPSGRQLNTFSRPFRFT